MKPFEPEKLYIEKGCENYKLGKELMEKYADKEMVWVDGHKLGTSGLMERIEALNKLYRAHYDVGILVAPVILLDGYERMYEELFRAMAERLDPGILCGVPLEIIFMTYGMVTKGVNEQAFPNAVPLYDPASMAFCGRARYGYTQEVKQRVSAFLREKIARYLPEAKIAYIV